MRAALLLVSSALLFMAPSACATLPPAVDPVPSTDELPVPLANQTVLGDAGVATALPSGGSSSGSRVHGSGNVAAPVTDSVFGENVSLFVVGVAFASLGIMGVSLRQRRRDASGVGQPGVPGILRLGQDAVERGDLQGALEWFETALSVQPDLEVALVCRGLCLRELGYEIDALEAFKMASNSAPWDVAPRVQCARSLVRLGRDQAAIAELDAVVQLAPETADVLLAEFAALQDHPMFLRALGKL